MILYKYLTVEKATEWLVGEDSILLTPPIYLNDLLEFRVRREPADLQERKAMFEMFQQESPCSLTFEEYDPAITTGDFMGNEAEAMRKMLSEALGVVSLTTDPANELMWAHYGLNAGVAIGYHASDIKELDGLRVGFSPLGPAIEANYSNAVVPMKKDFSDAPHQLARKRHCWSYEKEWRIVRKLAEATPVTRDNKTFYTLPAQRERIANVVFGANARPDFIQSVSQWLRGSLATRQQVQIDPLSHDLVLSEMATPFEESPS